MRLCSWIIKISIVAVITIIFILAILLLLDAVSRTLKKVEDAKIEIATINAETEHNKKIFSMVETFREIKHDYVAHLLTISAFANDNDIEGIKAYLSDLNSEYGIEDAFITTNNRVFDSILTAQNLDTPCSNTPFFGSLFYCDVFHKSLR